MLAVKCFSSWLDAAHDEVDLCDLRRRRFFGLFPCVVDRSPHAEKDEEEEDEKEEKKDSESDDDDLDEDGPIEDVPVIEEDEWDEDDFDDDFDDDFEEELEDDDESSGNGEVETDEDEGFEDEK